MRESVWLLSCGGFCLYEGRSDLNGWKVEKSTRTRKGLKKLLGCCV